jgi:hypothetical protein
MTMDAPPDSPWRLIALFIRLMPLLRLTLLRSEAVKTAASAVTKKSRIPHRFIFLADRAGWEEGFWP